MRSPGPGSKKHNILNIQAHPPTFPFNFLLPDRCLEKWRGRDEGKGKRKEKAGKREVGTEKEGGREDAGIRKEGRK